MKFLFLNETPVGMATLARAVAVFVAAILDVPERDLRTNATQTLRLAP